MTKRRARSARRESGFTMVEVLVALFIMTISLAALIGLTASGMKANAYARHATEASVVAEDKLEQLRVMTPANLTSGNDTCDAKAFVTATGSYTRTWTVSWNGSLATLTVRVSWSEDGQPHAITYRTMRSIS
jgi:type IV pilus assembly protein PilV